MTFKAFIFGLLGTFGLPWLIAVVIPYSEMRTLDPVIYEEGAKVSGPYTPARAGRITEGSRIYGQEGCYQCHTQVIRPTYAGNDVHRDEWAGLRQKGSDVADSRRETNAFDFQQEEVAHVGMSRVGPDLSNFGRRLAYYLKANKSDLTSEEWILMHLYNPRDLPGYQDGNKPYDSACPSKGGLFDEVAVHGSGSGVLPVHIKEGKGIKPTDRARALASYLTSLTKDTLQNPLPDALNYNPLAPATEE